MGEDDWNAARVLDGRPAAGAELTEEFNPLEAGLYHAVSLNKGCYIGQVRQCTPMPGKHSAFVLPFHRRVRSDQIRSGVSAYSDCREAKGSGACQVWHAVGHVLACSAVKDMLLGM